MTRETAALSAEEEAELRAVIDKSIADDYHYHPLTVKMLLATLDAARTPSEPGLREDVLQRMIERPLTSAYFEDYNAGRLNSEQVARALAGDYRAALSQPVEADGVRSRHSRLGPGKLGHDREAALGSAQSRQEAPSD